MTLPGAWEEIRHVVRIGGRVLDAAGLPLRNAAVTLWTAPEAGDPDPRGAAGAGPAHLCALLARARSKPDGLFFFLDCPAGRYVAQAHAAGGARGTGAVRVGAGTDRAAPPAVAGIVVAKRLDQGSM